MRSYSCDNYAERRCNYRSNDFCRDFRAKIPFIVTQHQLSMMIQLPFQNKFGVRKDAKAFCETSKLLTINDTICNSMIKYA